MSDRGIPAGATTVSLPHRVGFFETDGMGIVHHSNYLRYCENARVAWLETHDRAYSDWIASGLHFPHSLSKELAVALKPCAVISPLVYPNRLSAALMVFSDIGRFPG